MHAQPNGSNDLQHNPTAIIAWLQANTLPLQHIEAGNGIDDLLPLKTILANTKVVGLGETTHGTREIFQLKHRLVEFLVIELGFNAVAFEASYSGCQPINDYVLHGHGDLATALTGQGAVVWDTEEIVNLLDWLHAHNRHLPDEKKVRFYGLDSFNNDIGREAALNYLFRVAPDQAAVVRPLFEAMVNEEAKWPTLMDNDTRRVIGTMLPQFQKLINHTAQNTSRLKRQRHRRDRCS